MKSRFKIAVPYYYFVLSIFFCICILLLKEVKAWNSVGGILDSAFSLLAIVIFSNTYFIEKQLNTIDVYCMAPIEKRREDVIKRLAIKTLFLFILFLLTYFSFAIRKPIYYIGESKITILLNAIFAVWSSIIFWGELSCILVNLINNLWAGIGGSILLWLMMNSTFARRFPVFLDVFRYGSLNGKGEQYAGWQMGKAFSLLVGIILIVVNTRLIKRSPYK